jgi:hypothetical protein
MITASIIEKRYGHPVKYRPERKPIPPMPGFCSRKLTQECVDGSARGFLLQFFDGFLSPKRLSAKISRLYIAENYQQYSDY